MKTIFTLSFSLLIFHAEAQVAKSYNFNGKNIDHSGTYVEHDVASNTYFTASEKNFFSFSGNHSETVISRLDANGVTQWHSSIYHPALFSPGHAIGDIKTWNNFVFVSLLKYGSSASSGLTIYKMDFTGALLDSVEITPPFQADNVKPEMCIDGSNNIFTAVQDVSGDIYSYRVDPGTMDIIDQGQAGSVALSNPYASRGLFFEYDGTYSVLAYNVAGAIKFLKFDASGTPVSQFTVASPDGELTDFDYHDNGYHLLINKHFSLSTAADNPLRVIRTSLSGMVLLDVTFPVQHNVIFESIAIDDDNYAYVVGRRQQSSFNFLTNGTLMKIEGGAMVYEHPLKRTNPNEITVIDDQVFVSGSQRDEVEDCSTAANGSAFIRLKTSDNPTFQVVSPHMDFSFNNINAVMSYNSNDFREPTNNFDPFMVNGAGTTIYSSSLLIAGEDINGILCSPGNHYGNNFAAGPATLPADYTKTERDKWERVWMISKAEIDAHIAAYLAGDPNYKMPDAIKYWPANGDPAKGQSEQMARYADLNSNGIYEPFQGEYPLILGDYCVLSVYNDINAGFFENCGFMPVGVEVYEYAYGFNCSIDSSMQNTLFVHYEIVSKLSQTLYNTYVGNFVDLDINFPNDDYISSDPMRGMFYGRNGSAGAEPEQAYVILGSTSDEDALDNASGINVMESPNGIGYGNGTADDERLGMTNFVYFNNSGAVNGDPTAPSDYYKYMQSIWKNDQHVLFHGDGLSSGTTTLESTFMFQGDDDPFFWCTSGVDPASTWTEESCGNPPGDRRGLASSGPFTFHPDTLLFDIAYVTGMENVGAGYTSHEALDNNVDEMRSAFITNSISCGQDFDFYEPFSGVYPYLGDKENSLSSLQLFPNPTNGNITIKGFAGSASVSVYNISGELISSITANEGVTFDCSHLPDGVYFVRIKNDSACETLKFAKQ